MRVVEFDQPGGPEVLRIVDRPTPVPAVGEVLVRVVAAGVNRPDIQQRRGLYPPPPGASPVLGLDIAGIVEAVGPGVSRWTAGDAVCALTNGGGYADYCVVPAGQCLPIPAGLSFAEGAALPEVHFTAWNNIIWLGRLGEGETLLIQGGTSGVGMAGIQIARLLRNAVVYATAGSDEKRAVCEAIGAHAAIDYHGDWDAEIQRLTDGQGVDVILDAQAGPYTQRQLDLLRMDGRLVFIASHLGETADVNVRQLVRRRLTMTGSTLRPRPSAYKAALAGELETHVWPLLARGDMHTRIHASLPFDSVVEAHRILDANQQIGKAVLELDAGMASRIPAKPQHHGDRAGA